MAGDAANRVVDEVDYILGELAKQEYYSRGYLNSEGRTLIERLARDLRLLGCSPRIISKARRRGSFEDVARLRSMVEECLSKLGLKPDTLDKRESCCKS